VSRGVALAPEAVADLEAIYLYILDRAGSRVALGYVARLEAQIQSLAAFPERGGAARHDPPGAPDPGI
jgi:plasmid stabilization system protein ParE